MRGPVVPGLNSFFDRLIPNVNVLFVFEAMDVPYLLFVKAFNKLFRPFNVPDVPLLKYRNERCANLRHHMSNPNRS